MNKVSYYDHGHRHIALGRILQTKLRYASAGTIRDRLASQESKVRMGQGVSMDDGSKYFRTVKVRVKKKRGGGHIECEARVLSNSGQRAKRKSG